MTIKTLIKTPVAIPDRLQWPHTNLWHSYIARIRERVTGQLRGASVALIGSGALLVALGVGLRDLRRRIEHTLSLAD